MKTLPISLFAILPFGAAIAQDVLEDLDPITVIGSKDEVTDLGGSGYYVATEEIRKQNYNNINQVLAKVPGVYVREEDGYGNFPNISLRGGDGTRSEKVTLMEDGILTVPAPYSAPAAYYSPKVGRMSGLEVLKGSSQIEYGPQTTGGVINYLSTPVPEEQTFYWKALYGSDNTITSHLYFGDTVDAGDGEFGYLLELFHNSSDGFRKIENGTGFGGSDKTGFSLYEPMIKLFWEPDSAVKQRLEFKYGYTNLDADESYAGLSEADVRSRPDLRYAGTRFDNISTEQHRTYLKYLIEPTESLKLEFTGYYNAFERDWFKLDDVIIPGGPGSVRDALLDPVGLAVLRGRGEGTLVVRHNAREYESYGIQLRGDLDFETGSVYHELSFGARFHRDYVDRDQFDELYNQDATGAIVGRQFRLNNVRFEETDALALWLKDKIEVGDWTFTPGVRLEYIDQSFRDYSEDKSPVDTLDELAANRQAVTLSSSGSESYTEVSPGLSFNYDISEETNVFGGVHKGISIPGPRSAISSGVDVEESLGYELGARYSAGGFSSEFAWFFTDFDNLIAPDAGLGGADATNAGEAEVWGLEMVANYDPFYDSDAGINLPMYISATWTSAEFKGDTVLGAAGGDDIYEGATDGSDIPYVPEWKISAGVGLETEKWGANLDVTYTSSTFATGRNLDSPLDPQATAGAREGKIDSLFLVDLSGYYQITDNVKWLAGVSNLFDDRGVVSRIPRGPRANQGRYYYTGFELEF